MLHKPSEFGSNRCSVGAPVVLSDGLLGFRPLLATMILSTTFSPPSLLLCKVQYPPTRNRRSYAAGIIHSPLVWVLSRGSGENIA